MESTHAPEPMCEKCGVRRAKSQDGRSLCIPCLRAQIARENHIEAAHEHDGDSEPRPDLLNWFEETKSDSDIYDDAIEDDGNREHAIRELEDAYV